MASRTDKYTFTSKVTVVAEEEPTADIKIEKVTATKVNELTVNL